VSTELASKAGYAPALDKFLLRLAERNRDQPVRNGLFASHPETTERVERLARFARDVQTTALGSVRYALNVPYEPTPLTEIAVVVEGASGLAEGEKAEEAKKEEAPARRGFGLSALIRPSSANEREKESAQVQASGGSRGVGQDRLAKGGDNPNPVTVTVTPAEVAAFKNGIV
jgi:hypothetical protein